MKQIGGIGLILPGFLQRPPEYPEYAGREEDFLESLDYRGLTVYDIGAFEGVLTLFFAKQVGRRGRVIAFEPHPLNYGRVVENVGLNNLGNVTVKNVGVGSASGELDLIAPAGGLAGRASASGGAQDELESMGFETETFRVPTVAVDEEIESSSLPVPDLVKIDVEGLEYEVLLGMSSTLEARKPKLYVEIHGVGQEAKRANASRVVSFLAKYGYEMRHIESGQRVDEPTAERASEGHLFCV
jgi:FkbM family methyltransferase